MTGGLSTKSVEMAVDKYAFFLSTEGLPSCGQEISALKHSERARFGPTFLGPRSTFASTADAYPLPMATGVRRTGTLGMHVQQVIFKVSQ